MEKEENFLDTKENLKDFLGPKKQELFAETSLIKEW